ncbi:MULTISPECIES: hypothetical protein [unclassified Streptomyces]|uniref:hypothetical protein n=1 Tax=unclassified Streptomyces TaxID=2593676 RepID=UPI00081D51A9|nr:MULTISPECIES: hypothetical protein [unclassified Streptomyces]MYR30470.1 hypothetical protein [Streptomyces sp. SID4945]SCF49880.1 hypothetical protein GA0115257_123136 [Streptomyces sp. LcepLS]
MHAARDTASRRTVAGAAEARVRACTDTDTLDAWFDRALTVRTIAEVLDPPVG